MSIKFAKGQSGTVLLVAVTMGVLLSGFVAIALVQNLPGIFADKVNDAGAITDAEARAEYLQFGYLEQSARYSFYQAAYNTSNATRVDETDINDEYIFYGSGHGGWGGGTGVPIESMYHDYFDEVEDQGGEVFGNYVGDLQSSSPKCSYYLPNDRGASFDFKVVKKNPEVGVESSDGEPLINNVSCVRRPSVRAVYEVNRDNVEMETKRVHIHNMAVGAFRGMSEMWNESEDINDGNYDGSITRSSTCKESDNEGGVPSTIRTEAENAADNRVENLADRIVTAGRDGVRSATSELGIPLIDGLISWAEINFQFNVEELDRETSVTEASSSWSQCSDKCEDYSCEEGFSTSGTGDSTTCEPDSLPDPSCSEGDPNGDFCENTSADSQAECGSGQTWYDGPDVCDFDGDQPCSDYEGYDTIHTFDGGDEVCVLDEDAPEPTCDDYERSYSATFNYELSKILIHLDMRDDASVPVDLGPSVKIPMDRHFEYNFGDSGTDPYTNHDTYPPFN